MSSTHTIVTERFGSNADLAPLKAALVATVDGASLAAIVQLALDRRKQGRIDQSIRLMTQANRTQLDAIEDIQRVIDTMTGRQTGQVVFAKYRQFQPFEMGIENGEGVLALLDDFAGMEAIDPDRIRADLHEMEARETAEGERLAFFERRFDDGSEDDEIAEIRRGLQAVGRDIVLLKHKILEAVFTVVAVITSKNTNPSERNKQTLALSKSLYVLVTSPTATRHADDVRIEA